MPRPFNFGSKKQSIHAFIWGIFLLLYTNTLWNTGQKVKPLFGPNDISDVLTKLLLLLHIQPRYIDVLIEFHKNCYNSGNNRAKFLPLHSFILYGMLIRKIHTKSHGNFSICFPVFPAPWNLKVPWPTMGWSGEICKETSPHYQWYLFGIKWS